MTTYSASFSDRPLAVKHAEDAYLIKEWQHHHAAITVARNTSGHEQRELLDMLGLDLDQAQDWEHGRSNQ